MPERARTRGRPAWAAGAGLGATCVGVCVTTLVASAATTPLAAFHFQTIPTYGVLANLLAVPLTSFLVMPAGMLGLLLMPLGLEGPLFHVDGLGLRGRCSRSPAPSRACPAPRSSSPNGRAAALALPGCRRALAGAVAAAAGAGSGLVPCVAALGAVAAQPAARPPGRPRPRTWPRSRRRRRRSCCSSGTATGWSATAWLRSLGVATSVAGAEARHAAPNAASPATRSGCVVELGGPARALAHAGRGRGRGLRPGRSGHCPGRAGALLRRAAA